MNLRRGWPCPKSQNRIPYLGKDSPHQQLGLRLRMAAGGPADRIADVFVMSASLCKVRAFASSLAAISHDVRLHACKCIHATFDESITSGCRTGVTKLVAMSGLGLSGWWRQQCCAVWRWHRCVSGTCSCVPGTSTSCGGEIGPAARRHVNEHAVDLELSSSVCSFSWISSGLHFRSTESSCP